MVGAVGARGDRIAALAIAAVCVAATVVEVASLVRRRLPDRLLVAWAALTALSAATWLAVAVSPSSPVLAIIAVATTGSGLLMIGASTVWSRLPVRSLATARVLVDITAVGSA